MEKDKVFNYGFEESALKTLIYDVVRTALSNHFNESALKTLIYDVVRTALSNHGATASTPPVHEKPIKGIHELAKFLRISSTRAQKLKNEGVFPYWQDGRILFFDPDKVRATISKTVKTRKGKA